MGRKGGEGGASLCLALDLTHVALVRSLFLFIIYYDPISSVI